MIETFGQSKKELVCKLTTPELQERKRTVIADLKKVALEKVETVNGLRFTFEGADRIIDLLASFIKTERLCCDFFNYHVTIGNENDQIWFDISGPEGAKDFMKTELGF